MLPSTWNGMLVIASWHLVWGLKILSQSSTQFAAEATFLNVELPIIVMSAPLSVTPNKETPPRYPFYFLGLAPCIPNPHRLYSIICSRIW